MKSSQLDERREFLKDTIRLNVDFSSTDQHRGVPPPPIEKPCPPDRERIDLPSRREWQGIGNVDLTAAFTWRRSRRRYLDDPMTLDELAFLLWATQGIRKSVGPGTALRTVPSAGCRHAFETYLCALKVDGLEEGIYRYLPLEHQLVLEAKEERLGEKVSEAALGQRFVGQGAVTFIWTAVPYRMEWRYGLASHKVIAIDAGHLCQNLYLACTAVAAGTCAVAAYHQHLADRLLSVDGEEEFTVYLAPVGKVSEGPGENA